MKSDLTNRINRKIYAKLMCEIIPFILKDCDKFILLLHVGINPQGGTACFRCHSKEASKLAEKMGVIKRVVKPVTRKGKKMLLSKEPKLIEDTKRVMFIRGRKTNETLMNCMRDLYAYKKPDAILLSKKNDIVPFENPTPLEAFSKKLSSPLFVFGYSNKKRPNTLIFGRMFHHQILDMIEVGIENYKSIQEFASEKISTGLKPCLLFAGEEFKTNPDLNRFQNLLVDLFQREQIKSLRLQGLEHVLMFTAHEGKIYFRSFRILLKKSGTNLPRVELEEIGPSIDFKLQRTKLASADFFKTACKKPKELKVKKVKNVSHDAFGTKQARIHITKQNISKLQTRKMKGLKRKRSESGPSQGDASSAKDLKVSN